MKPASNSGRFRLDPMMLDVARVAAAFTDVSVESVAPSTLESLVDTTIDICDRLAIASEGTNGKQAG